MASISLASGKRSSASLLKISSPLRLTSNLPPPAGTSVSLRIFCLYFSSRWVLRPSALGS